jgi:shikimate kinase
MFNELGETAFRRIEHQMLQKLVRGIQFGKPTVMAVGGGAFVQQTNFDMLEDNGVSIWLDTNLELIRERISGHTHRPLAQDPVKFAELFQARQDGYARADYRVTVEDNDLPALIQRILGLPLFD